VQIGQVPHARRLGRTGKGGIYGDRPIWLVAPAAVLIVVIIVLPVLLGVYIAFFNVNVYTLGKWFQAPFVGVKNFTYTLLNTNSAVGSAAHGVLVSIKFAVLSTLVATPIGILGALTVNHRFAGRSFFRSWYLVPYVIPLVVTATVGRMMFLNGTGIVDRALSLMGVSAKTYWLLGPKAFWAMLAMEIWQVWPFTYLLILAGLAAVRDELYEAAEIDGGRYLVKLRYVVLPEVRGLLILSMVLSTIFHLGNFTLPFVMFSNPPPLSVAVLPIDVYYRAFTAVQFGQAAAAGVLMIVVFLIPAYIYIRASRLREALSS